MFILRGIIRERVRGRRLQRWPLAGCDVARQSVVRVAMNHTASHHVRGPAEASARPLNVSALQR